MVNSFEVDCPDCGRKITIKINFEEKALTEETDFEEPVVEEPVVEEPEIENDLEEDDDIPSWAKKLMDSVPKTEKKSEPIEEKKEIKPDLPMVGLENLPF
jgi:hypothetical protein